MQLVNWSVGWVCWSVGSSGRSSVKRPVGRFVGVCLVSQLVSQSIAC